MLKHRAAPRSYKKGRLAPSNRVQLTTSCSNEWYQIGGQVNSTGASSTASTSAVLRSWQRRIAIDVQ